MSCALVGLSIVLALFVAQAQAIAFPAPPSVHESAVVVEACRAAPSRDTVVRCARGRRVGMWIRAGGTTDLRGITVEDCPIGVVVESDEDADPQRLTVQAEAAPPTIESVTVTAATCLVGIYVLGLQATVTSNIVQGCDYGIVVSGDRHLVNYNRITGVRYDGILVLRQNSIIRGNTVTRAGRYGISVTGMAPQIGPTAYLPIWRERARYNLIERNVVTQSGQVDLWQWPVYCPIRGIPIGAIRLRRRVPPACSEGDYDAPAFFAAGAHVLWPGCR